MLTQAILRKLNCLSFQEFGEIFKRNGCSDESYIRGKHRLFCENLANFLMNLDEQMFADFVRFAENK